MYRDAPENPKTGSEYLTVKGNTLYKELQMKEETKLSKNPLDLSNTTFQIGTLDIDEQETLIPRLGQNNPVITSDHCKIFVWGYLTSHDGDGTFKIADKQLDGAKTLEGKDNHNSINLLHSPLKYLQSNLQEMLKVTHIYKTLLLIKDYLQLMIPREKMNPSLIKKLVLQKKSWKPW